MIKITNSVLFVWAYAMYYVGLLQEQNTFASLLFEILSKVGLRPIESSLK